MSFAVRKKKTNLPCSALRRKQIKIIRRHELWPLGSLRTPGAYSSDPNEYTGPIRVQGGKFSKANKHMVNNNAGWKI